MDNNTFNNSEYNNSSASNNNQYSNYNPPSNNNFSKIVITILILILTFPIWIPILVAGFSFLMGLFSIFITAPFIILGLVALAFTLFIAGIIALIQVPYISIFILGTGLILCSGAILLLMLCTFIAQIFVKLFKCLISFFDSRRTV